MNVEQLLTEAKHIGDAYTANWGALNQAWYDHRYDWARGPSYWYWMERGVYANRYIEDGNAVLDLCCGDGMYTLFYVDKARVVYGVDGDAHAVAHANAHYARPNVKFYHADALRGVWPIAEADVVTFYAALEHFTAADGRALLKRIADILAPGGRLIGSTPLFPQGDGVHAADHRNEFASQEELRKFLLSVFGSVELWTSRWNSQRAEMYFLCRR